MNPAENSLQPDCNNQGEYRLEMLRDDVQQEGDIIQPQENVLNDLLTMEEFSITCHKAQGLSLNTVFANIGEDVFQLGMAYVCLSRVRCLSNLYLIDFNPAQIRCCIYGYAEYQRLRPTAFPE
uniref:Uncharacterized protein n=1 Tax=Plectus sambesii TaxID=2011161 RepID=A0A914WV63_9BILA